MQELKSCIARIYLIINLLLGGAESYIRSYLIIIRNMSL